MPAKPLSQEQKRDAARLKQAFKMWQSARREKGESFTQDDVAEDLFGIGQSALSQYLNGTIPLNPKMLGLFSRVLGVQPENVSPTIAAMQRELAAVYAESEQMTAEEAKAIVRKAPSFAPLPQAPSPASQPTKTRARSSERSEQPPSGTAKRETS